MKPTHVDVREMTRRHFFEQAFGTAAGISLGSVALATLLGEDGYAKTLAEPARPFLTHPPKVKRIVYLQMAGGAPHVDLFDYKPALKKFDGIDAPESLYKGQRFAFITGVPKMGASPFTFKQYGQSGAWFSEVWPNLSRLADDLTFLKGMQTTQFNHGPAQIYMTTGHQISGRPAFGSWLSYGIGSENKDLPTYVVLLSGNANPDGGTACWGSGFLPTIHQGVPFQKRGDPINFVSNAPGVSADTRRRSIDLLNQLNESNLREAGDPEILTRIEQYELAYKMQSSVPELTDIAKEPPEVLEKYGAVPGEVSYGKNALLARRLLEHGVRFVHLIHRNWDMHGGSAQADVYNKCQENCRQVDGPTAALITDLKERGMFEDTLIIWASEFGRTPMRQGIQGGTTARYFGRDHHPKGYTIWMAGGGLRPGMTYGATDEWGYWAVEGKTNPLDVFATALNQLGIDHEKFTYTFQGRPYRLTFGAVEEGRVVNEILA
jgi:hypothetical protein